MSVCVLGAGVTGLAAGMATGAPVFEASDGPGGLCRSYYRRAGDDRRFDHAPPDDDAYRFEVGGGHWIFGGDGATLQLLEDLCPLVTYERRASVHLGALGAVVPYPLQRHVELLGGGLAAKVAAEGVLTTSGDGSDATLDEWLRSTFGPTLCAVFFSPFNDRYTAGLSGVVAAQDRYKSPAPVATSARAGLTSDGGAKQVGYNAQFRYPTGGLDRLVGAMERRCDVRYNKRLVEIDTEARTLVFADGSAERYRTAVSTLPLHVAATMAGIAVVEPPDPHTSVLVLNIGAVRGPRCPTTHWQYEPDASSGFHRIGFYSNVDTSFLPAAHRAKGDRVSLYVERAFRSGGGPSPREIAGYSASVLSELTARGYIGAVEVVDPSWVEVAYTWRRPRSTWRERAIDELEAAGIVQVGRYGAWHFQGIAESVNDGLAIKRRLESPVVRDRDGP